MFADPWCTHQKLIFDKLILTEAILGLTIKTFEVMPGSVCEGSHGVVTTLFHQPHCFRPQ